ncbi:MAG: anti-sigma factor [Bacteroidota bacterium]
MESYVLGLASAEEQAEFEQLCMQYPELVAARNSFELSLEKQAFENAPQPPGFVKEQLVNLISQESVGNQSKVIQMNNTELVRKTKGFNWLAAASVLLVVLSAYFAYNFYSENKTLKSELVAAKNSQAKMDERIKKMEENQEVVGGKDVMVISLTGTTPAKASANIYWDSTSTNVYLVVKNMPQLPSDKQYQLWALIDGKPKDLGLFDTQGDNKVMLKMNNTQKADAFAITIENRGNTGGPNLKQLQMMEKTKL